MFMQAYDGGIGMGLSTEGHGGTTYTAIASLYLMNRLDRLRDAPSLLRWAVLHQGSLHVPSLLFRKPTSKVIVCICTGTGFRGRPEKDQVTRLEIVAFV